MIFLALTGIFNPQNVSSVYKKNDISSTNGPFQPPECVISLYP